MGVSYIQGLSYNTGLTPATGVTLSDGTTSSDVVASTFTFTSSLPSGFTYTRADTVATYRNSSGELTLGASNTPCFNYTITGEALGIMLEPSRVNLCTNNNATPAATTNMSVTGTATLSINSDSAAVSAFKMANVVTGGVFEASGGASGGTVIISGATGATGAFSASLVARVTSGASASFGITPTPTATTISGSAYARFLAQNLTATAATDTFVITIPASTTIRFILNQLEAGANCSSMIKTAGASATRAAVRLFTTNLSTTFGAAWNQSQGALVFTGSVSSGMNVNSTTLDGMYCQFSDNSTSNRIGLRKRASATENGYVQPLVTVATVVQSAVSNSKPYGVDKHFGCAITWTTGTFSVYAGSGRGITETGITMPSVILTRFDIGTAHNGGSALFGHVKTITVMNQYRVAGQLGQYYIEAGSRGIASRGQSLIDNDRRSQVELDNTGEVSFRTALDNVWTSTAGKNYLIHGATGGSSMVAENAGATGYWYDTATGVFGTAYDTCANAIKEFKAAGGIISAIVCDGHEQDAGALLSGITTEAEYKAADAAVNSALRALIGSNVPILYMPTTNRNDTQAVGYQILRELQKELAAEDISGSVGPEKFDLPLADAIHKTSAGYTTLGNRTARKVLKILGESVTGVDGPRITAATRVGTAITVTIAHDAGTDFTPTTSISGFHFFNDTTEISITAAVRTNATTITLTLASLPTGVETLYYGYASLFTDTIANLVLDNASTIMPLRSVTAILPYSG